MDSRSRRTHTTQGIAVTPATGALEPLEDECDAVCGAEDGHRHNGDRQLPVHLDEQLVDTQLGVGILGACVVRGERE